MIQFQKQLLLAMTFFDPLWHMQVKHVIVSKAPKWTPNGMKINECPFYEFCFSFEWLLGTCSTLTYLTQASKIHDCVIWVFSSLLAWEKLVQDFLSFDISSMHKSNKVLMSIYPFSSMSYFRACHLGTLLLTRF